MDANELTGSVKVAILVKAVGLDAARPILSRFSDQDRQLIQRIQSRLGSIPPAMTERVAREFIEGTGIPPQLLQLDDGDKPPPEPAKDAKKGLPKSTLEAVQDIEPAQLIQLIKDEHPQTIALILAHLDPNVSSGILGRLPDQLKADVALRIANLDKVLGGMIKEIDKVFEEILKNKDFIATQEAGGVANLAEILNMIDGTTVEQIIDEIEENDPELAEEIKQMMFVFEDIVLVDDKGLQKVLRSVESQELAIALKAASDDVKNKIFRNMSQRAAEILREEMEVTGAVRMKDVTDAQQKVTRIIQDMERKGELIISGRGGEEFIG
ncbi:flagellar motor switch protein FliG [Desulfatitalea alkaliphila]|uniref:Flagellar motor switch protein FliG n=1 Tax=Desulfatitalea alkaliphila TaxID=2929485 RepID=A0AA41R5C4_9BACT|nr:flagellar motor switch protein FliG [Desulfatitalea alkaliphila]MCJ8501310.1 flagellar motor switch protein FliG [Desulfatitalea alkaliphila]